MAKRGQTMRKRRAHGGFRMSFERDPTQRTLNPFTWFRSNAQVAPLEEVVVNKMNKPVPVAPAPTPLAPNTIIEVKEPAPEAIRVIGEANAQGIPPTLPPGAPGLKVEGGRRRTRSTRHRSARRKTGKRSARVRSARRRSARRKH